MADLTKQTLRLFVQKDAFTHAEERLIGIATVTKPGRKKKPSYLCVSVNADRPPKVSISRVKQDEVKRDRQNERPTFRKVKTWSLSDLRIVDGRSVEGEVAEFDLHFDKGIFKWTASSVAEKKAFVVCLYKMVYKYLDRKKPEFIHVDESRLRELIHTSEARSQSRAPGADMEEEGVTQEEYQELTDKEQEDLEQLLKEEESKRGSETGGIHDVAAFTEHLSQQLAQLDDANIHTLMDSESQIQSLMRQLDVGLREIHQMDTKLSVYDELLASVRATLNKLQQEYSRIMLWDKNLRLLLDQVQEIMNMLFIDPRVKQVLQDSSLVGDTNIRDCANAVKDIQRCQLASQQLDKGLQMMQVVSERKSLFVCLSQQFGNRLQEHIYTVITQHSTKLVDNVTQRQSGIAIPSHSVVHNDLMAYCELMRWMKECENEKYVEVLKAYRSAFKRTYESEIKAFVADVKSLVGRGSEVRRMGGGGMSRAGSAMDVNLSRFGGGSPGLMGSPRLAATSLLDVNSPMKGSMSTGDPDKLRFDQVFLMVVEQLQPVTLSEQKFCTAFFHFPRIEAKPCSDSNEALFFEKEVSSAWPGPGADGGLEQTDRGFLDTLANIGRHRRTSSTDNNASVTSGGVLGTLGDLFSCLLPELEGLIQFGEKLDVYNPLYLLVAVKQRMMFAHEGGKLSFADRCLDQSQLCITRLLNKLVETKKKAIEESKVPRKSGKCGILPCVVEFERFAEHAERIMMGSTQREEVDGAYHVLIEAVFESIEHLAHEHPKTPADVVKFENYYKLYDILSTTKISCLESHREEAKKKYRAHQAEYVIACLGRPLEKLSVFFEGVEGLLASGIKPEQIGFYRDYNRTELQKCIKEYPSKEVKRGLEKLYRRMEKDLSEEVGQLRVTCGIMTKQFMEQFQHFEKLIEKCYPGSNLQLEFSLSDIIHYFQTISEGK